MMENERGVLEKEELKRWDVQRKALETEADAIVSELTTASSNGGGVMGLDTPLVDADGYPRNDIDVYRARTLRNRLAIIRTDHKQLMKQISNGLLLQHSLDNTNDENEKEQRSAVKPKPKFDPITQKWVVKNWDGTLSGIQNGHLRSFDQISSSLPTTTTTSAVSERNDSTNNNNDQILSTSITTQQQQQSKKAFATIDQVNNNSPASEAGLQLGDDIIQFGTLTTLQGILPLVSTAAANQTSIPLIIRRNNTIISISIFPKPWAGRGLLGCHIQPIYE